MTNTATVDPLDVKWGFTAPDSYSGPQWGARAIYELKTKTTYSKVKSRRQLRQSYKTEAYIDIPHDRQQMTGGDPDERKALANWVNSKGMKLLKAKLVDQYVTGDSEATVVVHEDGFYLWASPRASYGYLYIGCYRR